MVNFLIIVEAKEVNGGKLSSTATVTVEVLDLNDNSPQFPKDSYTAIVSESSPEGQKVISIVAEDRDRFGFCALNFLTFLSDFLSQREN